MRGYELQEKSSSSRRRGAGPCFVAFFLVGGGSSVLKAWGWLRVRERLVEIGDTPKGSTENDFNDLVLPDCYRYRKYTILLAEALLSP